MNDINSNDYSRYKELIDMHLVDLLPDVDQKSITLYESMKYSLMAGGKRLRPALLMGACEFCGGKVTTALPYACAMEYVHTYSLIHDDLPCMDDDAKRRGLATNHIIYGEAIAMLAGDGLLTAAFEAMNKDMFLHFDDQNELKKRIRASYDIAKGAGCQGMIAGQTADIENEGKTCSEGMLDYIHLNKTGALITAAIRAGAHLGGADDETLDVLTDYAEDLGLAFQICDDILDINGEEDVMGKKSGVDVAKGKATYPALYGIDRSYERLHELSAAALKLMEPYYDNAEFFNEMVMILEERTK